MRGTAERTCTYVAYARRRNASAYLVRTRGERFAQTSWSLVYQASIASKECSSASVSRVSRPTWPRRDTRVVTRAKMHALGGCALRGARRAPFTTCWGGVCPIDYYGRNEISSVQSHSTKNPAFISIEWTVNVGAYINVFIIYKLLKVNWLWSKSINVFYKCNYLYHI